MKEIKSCLNKKFWIDEESGKKMPLDCNECETCREAFETISKQFAKGKRNEETLGKSSEFNFIGAKLRNGSTTPACPFALMANGGYRGPKGSSASKKGKEDEGRKAA